MGETNRQIEALETELARLRETLDRLGAAMQETAVPPRSAFPPASFSADLQLPSFYWLGKVAATLAVALFSAVHFLVLRRAESGPALAGSGAVALLLLCWGLRSAVPGMLIPQTALACGLAGLFLSALHLVAAHPSPAFGAAVMCAVIGGAVAARWRQTEAAFSVVGALACLCGIPEVGFSGTGGLGMSIILSLCALFLAGPRSGTFPVWTASAAAYVQLALPLAVFSLSREAGQTLAGLLLVQSVAILGCVRYVARGGQRVFNATFLAFANCVLCLAVASSVLGRFHGYSHAAGMALAAALFAGLAGVAHRWKPATHLMMAALCTAAMAAAAMAMWSGLPEAFFAPALAAAAAALVIVHRQTGSPLLRRLETLSALAAFGFCLFRLQLSGLVPLGAVTFPSNWVNALGTMFFLCAGATLHEKCFPGGLCAEVHHGKAMARAALAGLILLTITVLERGADAALPFVLAAESLGMIGLGLVLLTPQIGVAGMLLLAPAHLCYHAFLFQSQFGFAAQPDFMANTAGLIAFTLAGAVAWERYLHRFHLSTVEWDHYAVVSLPFLASAYLSCTTLRGILPPSLLPAGLAAAGVLYFVPARLMRLDGMTLAAVFCLAAAAFVFGRAAHGILGGAGASPDWLFVPGAAATAVLFVTAERLTVRLFPGGVFGPHWSAQDARSLVGAATAAAVASTAVVCATQGAPLGWGLAGTGLLCVYVGRSCGIGCYVWLGSAVALAVPALAAMHYRGMAPGLSSVAALTLAAGMAVAQIRRGIRQRFTENADAPH